MARRRPSSSLTYLINPVFATAGSSLPVDKRAAGGADITLTVSADPSLTFAQLPLIDTVLLSQEEHLDNLDEAGRQLSMLLGWRAITTVDGVTQLSHQAHVPKHHSAQSTSYY
jgi:hypothetical protein